MTTNAGAKLIRADVMKIAEEIRLLKWMTCATFVAVMAVLIKLLRSVPYE